MNIIVLDTETCNTMDDPFVYDIGWAVLDENFNILQTRSFVVADVFLNEPELMATAYFAEKIPQYRADLNEGTRILRRYKTIRNILREDCERFNVGEISAHNMNFDYRSTNTTQRWLTSSKYRYFFPYGVRLSDTLKMARQTFGKDEAYRQFCKENDFCCQNGTPRLTAEIIYRYITGNVDFEESHTGLEDVLIEKEIYRHCMEMNPEVDRLLWQR